MLPQLMAERQLERIEAASAPHLTAKGHRELIGALRKQIVGKQPARPATEADLATFGITVERVGPDGLPVGDGTRSDEIGGES